MSLTGLLIVSTPAQAARVCNTSTPFYQSQVPTFGYAPFNPNCVMGQGANSSAVKALQKTLNGCYHAGLKVDGVYGPKTTQAVRNAQRKIGTTPDGVYGPNTRDRLEWHFPGSSHPCQVIDIRLGALPTSDDISWQLGS